MQIRPIGQLLLCTGREVFAATFVSQAAVYLHTLCSIYDTSLLSATQSIDPPSEKRHKRQAIAVCSIKPCSSAQATRQLACCQHGCKRLVRSISLASVQEIHICTTLRLQTHYCIPVYEYQQARPIISH
ncbi:hypothetical protein LI328DRAFT_61079 [Trichoderma asperelloides]|nr:hypothetical protein LI328DRAFT_61079 [Trichoderma asperelloides]